MLWWWPTQLLRGPVIRAVRQGVTFPDKTWTLQGAVPAAFLVTRVTARRRPQEGRETEPQVIGTRHQGSRSPFSGCSLLAPPFPLACLPSGGPRARSEPLRAGEWRRRPAQADEAGVPRTLEA